MKSKQSCVGYIIPKLNKCIKNNTGKRCIRHHNTLCKVCNLVRRAHLVQKQKLKSEASRRHADDPKNHGSDPPTYNNDPRIDGNDPFLLATPLEKANHSAAAASQEDPDYLESKGNIGKISTAFESPPLPQLFDESLELNPVKGTTQKASAKKRCRNKRKAKKKPGKCPSCGGCTCSRGTFIQKGTRGRKDPLTVLHPTPTLPPSILGHPSHEDYPSTTHTQFTRPPPSTSTRNIDDECRRRSQSQRRCWRRRRSQWSWRWSSCWSWRSQRSRRSQWSWSRCWQWSWWCWSWRSWRSTKSA